MSSFARAVLHILFIFNVVLTSAQATAGTSSYRVVEPKPNEILLCIVSSGTTIIKESEIVLKIDAEIALINRRIPSESRIVLFSFPLNELDVFAKNARESRNSLFGEMLKHRLEELDRYLLACAKNIPFDPDAQQAIEILKKGMSE